ncbi:tetratricopeptide repeat protein [Treponema sp.]|uniref:tetratricopeptide repeat protein n=1 Tax=Treponema sp. TaxID=166 RepID=UPI001DF4CAFB|nr:tetratricopeptide repeat protein [Treponema sp.]MBS7242516.1 tetratricopeptide repeat protein [Treponema sp.]MCI6441612.1 tetratricopeptide repeat protein [Spirochaetia bacterium]MDY4132594.1 tetratricopeptide repeat protein [Treponema sp.]
MASANPLDSIYFVKIPADAKFSSEAMKIDSSVELPVQKKNLDDPVEEDFAKLSEEQILSGILTVLAYDRENKNSAYYRKLITDIRPNIKKELAEAAILKAHDEEWELAEEIWLAVHGIDPEDYAIILNLAIFYDQKADSFRRNTLNEDADAFDDLALTYYKKVLDSDKELPDGYFNAGFFYLKKSEYGEAKACFESFLALTSDKSDEELGENGGYKKERAQEIINKISNRNLESDRFHDAYKYISSGQEEKGLEEIRKFLVDNPAVWNAWFLLGWGLRRLGRFADAKAAFLKARECEGGDENADTLNELAICQMETGDTEEAYDTLKEALSMDCENTKVISNLGFLSLKLGKTDEAKKYFEVVLELDPEDKIAKEELKKL